MKTTTLLFISFLLFTQCYKTTRPAFVSAASAINGADNYVGWNNYTFLSEQTLHINSTPINLYNTGSLRISVGTYQHLPDFYYGLFIDKHCNPNIPVADTINLNTDSEIKIHETNTLLFNNPLPLPGC